ncbi:MAG: electron transfer flavoprotein subunit beta, partial [Lachnospiraceae bacterium]|nr:electron transfer flavoprotein subunit beta [Lachnospiraceae bacterium]
EPRYMSIGGIFRAYRKEIKVWGLKDLEDTVDVANIGLKGSPTKVKRSFTKQAKGAGEKFNVVEDEAVAIIVNRLAERHLI